MPREKEGFREQLARLDEQFPGREAINIQEAIQLTGLDRRTLLSDQDFPARKMGSKASTGGKYMIPKVAFAKWLVGGAA